MRGRVYDKFIITQIVGNITRWIQRATRPSDLWQRCIQLVIFPGICAIIYIYIYIGISFVIIKINIDIENTGISQI